jgi:excinuclease ABC subunit C
MVVAIKGQMDHSQYRHFGIKTLQTPNDFAMMKETILRRQQHPEWGEPDVLLIDGGKGQLRSVLSVWKWAGVVVSIAKDPDRLIIPIKIESKLARAQYRYHEIKLGSEIPATRLLQTIRDESHRFSRRLHHIKRDKQMFA